MTKDKYFVLKVAVMYIIIALFVLAAISLFISTVIAQPVYKEPGTCYEVINTTATVCASNITIEEIDVDLEPGESRTFNSTYSRILSSCTACEEATETICSVEERLDPGERYQLQTPSCDIDIRARDCEREELDVLETVTYELKSTIEYDQALETLLINFEDKQYRIQVDEGTGDTYIERNFEFDCPVYESQSEQDAETILQQCKDVVPVYCTDMTSLLIAQTEESFNKQQRAESELEDCRADLTARARQNEGKVVLTSEEHAMLLSGNDILRNETDRCMFQEGMMQREIDDLEDTRNGLIYVSFLGWLLFIIQKVGYSPRDMFKGLRG